MARAVITGARRGIGREIALSLARAGHTVVATMRNTDGCDLAEIAAREHLPITLARLDVDDDASVATFFGAAAEPIDILINNAGILSINAVEDESIATMQAIMNTNFFGAVRCMKAVVPAMRARGSGLIINISSIAGRMAPFAQGAYAASKFALEAASEALAQELAPFGVRVALVEPGIIASDMAVEQPAQPARSQRLSPRPPHAGFLRRYRRVRHPADRRGRRGAGYRQRPDHGVPDAGRAGRRAVSGAAQQHDRRGLDRTERHAR